MPALRRKPKIISIANQKGGVGKTTTAINLGASLATRDQRVLLLDIDPQGNASTGLGSMPDDRNLTTYDVIIDQASLAEAIENTEIDNLDLIPSTTDLSSADVELVDQQDRIGSMKAALSSETIDNYDYVLIDCPPSLNLLTVNALVASHSVLVPLQAEFFALEGLTQLLKTVRDVRQAANPKLRIEGVVLTMYDQRNKLCHQVERDVRENLGKVVYQTMIPRNVRLSEAPSFAMSVVQYDPQSRGAIAYKSLAAEILRHHGKEVA